MQQKKVKCFFIEDLEFEYKHEVSHGLPFVLILPGILMLWRIDRLNFSYGFFCCCNLYKLMGDSSAMLEFVWRLGTEMKSTEVNSVIRIFITFLFDIKHLILMPC